MNSFYYYGTVVGVYMSLVSNTNSGTPNKTLLIDFNKFVEDVKKILITQLLSNLFILVYCKTRLDSNIE